MKEKFIKKYMRIARHIGFDQNPCYSRKIGVVIVDPILNKIIGTGYNGPPPGTPHCDSTIFLNEYFWPQLTESEKESFRLEFGMLKEALDSVIRDKFVEEYADCGVCPRRLIKAKSGERSNLCSCGHAERHAITNASCSLHNAMMFAWCGVPCLQCSDSIIHSGIKTVHCLSEIYHDQSEWLLDKGGVKIIKHSEDDF